MAELFGAIQRGLGSALNSIYELTGSYAIAIILLTVAVRALLIPLTVKQTRSMKKMQELGPQQKELQKKFKERQQKAKDRMELQQIRLEMNREVQELYRSAGVNPLGGCLPLLAQMPVFIAMFSIMRAAITILPQEVSLADGGSLTEAFAGADLAEVSCRPYDESAESELPPYANGSPATVRCAIPNGEPVVVNVGDFEDKTGDNYTSVPWLSECTPFEDGDEIALTCRSALGTGHVPVESELFRDLSVDEATIVGLLPGCSANLVGSDLGMRRCTSTKSSGDTSAALPYYLLVLLIVGTSYYQTKQMQSRQTSQVADQQRMMLRIMPVFFGFISLSIPAGANTYFLASNVWTIGQQYLMFREKGDAPREGGDKPGSGKPVATKKEIESRPVKQKPSQQGKPSGKRAAEARRKPKNRPKQKKRR